MAIHSSTLAGKIPGMEEPDRLPSMESQSRTRLSDFTFTLFLIIPHPLSPTLPPDRNTYGAFSAASVLENGVPCSFSL